MLGLCEFVSWVRGEESVVRRRAGRLLAATVAAIGVCGVAACAGPADTSKPALVGAGATTGQVTADQAKPQIVSAFQNFMNAYVAAFRTSDATNQQLHQYGNAGGANVGVELSLAKDANLIATGAPAWSGVEVTAVTLASYTASVAACFDPGSWQFVSTTTGKPADLQEVQLYPPPEPRRTTDKKNRYAITAAMRLVAGNVWQVAEVRAHRDQKC